MASHETQPAATAVRTTRLAPSPTGALHLGNARTFLVNWALARQLGWRIVLRIEDLDTPRTKPGAARQAVEDLRWLGMDWDEGPYYQAADLAPYRSVLEDFRRRGLIYPCTCTRSEIERAQSAPHADEHELRYPGTCRPRTGAGCGAAGAGTAAGAPADGPQAGAPLPHSSSAMRHSGLSLGPSPSPAAWRLVVPDETVSFTDAIHGPQAINVQQQVGDFVVASKNGLPAYQLAVVVDDARQGVTDVVRGDDLLRSTARQILLYRLLGGTAATPPPVVPRYWHLPLVLGPDGRRLAKRHGDSRIATYRAAGVSAERIIGLIAHWGGVQAVPRPLSPREFRDGFRIASLPRAPVTFSLKEHAWLLPTR